MASDTLALFPDWPVVENEQNTGLLPSQKLAEAVEAGFIHAHDGILADQIQPSSIDLRLGPIAYRVSASFLPRANATVAAKMSELVLETIDLSKKTILNTDSVYIVPLKEELNLPGFLWGKANPKSTTGRLDIFTRLLSDYADEFESVPNGCKGRLYAEIVPKTFRVIVQEGSRLNQLRLVKGRPSPAESTLYALHENEGLVYLDRQVTEAVISKKSLWLSLDLMGTNGSEIVGYKARKNSSPIDLTQIDHYDPAEYWDAIGTPRTGSITLSPDEFYILASKERVRIPPEFAAEMVPFDPSVGEFRIHYAGFFDPGFGCRADDHRGTHAVLEVRSHGIPFLVEDGQRIGRLIFERMTSIPQKQYGREIGSSYQFQGLALSKQFKKSAMDLATTPREGLLHVDG